MHKYVQFQELVLTKLQVILIQIIQIVLNNVIKVQSTFIKKFNVPCFVRINDYVKLFYMSENIMTLRNKQFHCLDTKNCYRINDFPHIYHSLLRLFPFPYDSFQFKLLSQSGNTRNKKGIGTLFLALNSLSNT